MWRPWAKSTVKVHGPSHRFSCSSFKDIQLLCSPSPDLDPSSSSSSSTYQRQRSIFLPPLSAASPNSLLLRSDSAPPSLPKPKPEPGPDTASAPLRSPGIVVYYTSLRVVRPTFEACRAVQSILQGFRVRIDERDLSMDPGFLTELQGVLGKGEPTLPRVFINGRYIGGAEEVKQLHEVGELKKLVDGLPTAEPGVCDACGDYRFVLCAECNGSHKIYADKSGFKSCTACNENGLLRCPSCHSSPPPLLIP